MTSVLDDADSARPGRVRRSWRWWKQSNAALMTSGIFTALLAAGLVWIVVFPAPPSSPPPVGGRPAPVLDVTRSASPSKPPPPTCAEQAAVEVTPEQLVLTSWATSWYRMGSVMAPWSIAGGPVRGDPVNACFTRTPEGALYAVATRIASEAMEVGVDGWRFSGFRWNSYTPDLAVVIVATTPVGGAGLGAAWRFTAVWQDDDWRVLDPAPADSVPIDSLRTFTPWGSS